MLRQFALAVALMAFGAETARSACPGQTGKTIFADDFSDDSGGWDINAHEKYAPSAFQIMVPPQSIGFISYNQTFVAADGDYCTVIAVPAEQPEPGNRDISSIAFLGTDYNNRFQFSVYSDSEIIIWKLQSGIWTSLFEIPKEKSVNTDPGSQNTLRVVVKNQKMTFFINGTQIKVLRAQTPDGANKFGFSASASNPLTKERVYSIKSFSLTEAP